MDIIEVPHPTPEKSIGGILTLLPKEDSELPPERNEISQYIARGVLPNVYGLYAEINRQLDTVTTSNEKINLREQLFVESVRMFTHPEILKRVTAISERINQDKDKPYVGLILVGSGALGGLLIREASGTSPEINDLDLLGTFDPDTVSADTSIYSYFSESVLPEITKSLNDNAIKTPGSRDYRVCDAHNPAIYNRPQYASEKEAMEALNALIAPNEFAQRNVDATSVLIRFFPSYPDYHNAMDRYYILSALSDIGQNDPLKWTIIKTQLVTSFKEKIHPFKSKYFGKENHHPIQNNLDKANEYFVGLFDELLQQTNPV